MAVEQVYSVKDFRAVCNQILETAFAGVIVEGEVASFKVNQGKYVFFDLKDDEASVGCFMMKFALRFPLEDGMKVRVRALPKLTDKGRFSLTVQAVVPVGEGSLKKSFEFKRLSDFTFTVHFNALEKEMAAHSSVLAWRIPGTGGAWWAAVYVVAQSRTRLK